MKIFKTEKKKDIFKVLENYYQENRNYRKII